MLDEIRAIKSGRKELQEFALAIAVALLILAGVLFFRKGFVAAGYCVRVSLLLLIIGIYWPVILKPVQKTWMSIAFCIGWVMTSLIMVVLFYLVLFPVSLIARIFRKRFLDTTFKKTDRKRSCWIIRTQQDKEDLTRFERQF